MAERTDFISEGIRNYLEQKGKKSIWDEMVLKPEKGLEMLGGVRGVSRDYDQGYEDTRKRQMLPIPKVPKGVSRAYDQGYEDGCEIGKGGVISLSGSQDVRIIQAGRDVHIHPPTLPPIEKMIENYDLLSRIFKARILCREPFVLILCFVQGNLLIFLVDANLLPVKGSQINLRQKERLLGSAVSNQEGMFTFEKIRAGKYNLEAKHPAGNKEFEIEVDEPTLSEPLKRFIEGNCRIFFMPIVSFFNGEIYGYEALARDPNKDSQLPTLNS